MLFRSDLLEASFIFGGGGSQGIGRREVGAGLVANGVETVLTG
jgi:hypothetical protein